MQVETKHKLMTIVEVAKTLKCSQNRLQRFIKSGELKRQQGERRGTRGIIPYVIDVEEARALLEEKAKNKTKTYKRLSVIVNEETYQKVLDISKSTGLSLNAIGKKVFEINLDKVVDSLYDSRSVQEIFVEKLQNTFKVTSVFQLTRVCNDFQQTIRTSINNIFRNEERPPRFNIIPQFLADVETNELTAVQISISMYATNEQIENENFKAFFDCFNINVKLLFEALLRGEIHPEIKTTDHTIGINKDTSHTVLISDNGMIL